MQKKKTTFRVGKVQGYRRGKAWYLCYFENGKRHRPRVGLDKDEAQQLAAQINGQVQIGAPATLSFQTISIPDLRGQWLDHHEQILRSSVQTIARYRTATEHLLRFLDNRPVKSASQFSPNQGEAFVRYLRKLNISPNGHPKTAKRALLDKGLCYILECCRALFNFAKRQRYLSPYAENPFHSLEIDRIPVEEFRPIHLLSPEQECAFFSRCDKWQLPVFLTLALTGLRPGELCHLLLPEDIDLVTGTIFVRNKPKLGWQIKTRNERDIPLVAPLTNVLKFHLNGRRNGPVFLRKKAAEVMPPWTKDRGSLELELENRVQDILGKDQKDRDKKFRIAESFWRALGGVGEDRIRLEYMRVTAAIGLPHFTAPKLFRHQFATTLQEGRVDPLIRNELLGHVATGQRTAGHGLAMTAVYTHTRQETRRSQLEQAMLGQQALLAAESWLEKNGQNRQVLQPSKVTDIGSNPRSNLHSLM